MNNVLVRIDLHFPPGSERRHSILIADFLKVGIADVARALWEDRRYYNAIDRKIERYAKAENLQRPTAICNSHVIEFTRLKDALIKMCHREKKAKEILEENIDALIAMVKAFTLCSIEKQKDKLGEEFELQKQRFAAQIEQLDEAKATLLYSKRF